MPLKINYFTGTSNDIKGLVGEFEDWLKEAKPAGYQLNSTVHFDVELKKWNIIVTVLYQEGAGSQIAVPTMMFPKQAD